MATLGRTKLTSFALLLAGMLGAQTIQLKQADRFTVVNLDGRSVTKLRGRVKLASAEGVFTCDSADWYRGENRLFAYHNVRFAGREGLVIRSRFLEYLNGESYFSGGVTVSDGDQSLKTSSLRYSTSTKKGIFSQRAELSAKDGNLTCRRGDFNGGSYRFYGDVRWTGANDRLYSEQMDYRSEQGSVQLPLGGSGRFDQDSLVFGGGTLNLRGSRYFDFSNGVQGWGPSRQFSSDRFRRWSDADRSEWTGSAYLADWEGDSTELWADLLTTTPDSINARGNASVAMPSWSGRAERWRGHRRDSLFLLEGSPVVWSEDYQILAKQFNLSQIGPGDSLWANEGVHLGEASDSSGRCNQMAAESMRARILNGRMQRMDLETNAEALFYPEDGPASRMKSGRIELWFKSEGGIDELRFYPSPSGSAVNETAPSYLPGYADRWGERPSRTAAMSGLK
jgi:hypothetical protein